MCFIIDESVTKPPRNRHGWKVVRLEPTMAALKRAGKGRGWHTRRFLECHVVSAHMSGFRWRTGRVRATRHAFAGMATYSQRTGDKRAWEGIYVFYTKAAALREWGGRYNRVLLRVELDPKDFLHCSKDHRTGRVATYRQVTVPEDQPYIEWLS